MKKIMSIMIFLMTLSFITHLYASKATPTYSHSIINGFNDFAFNLYRQVNQSNENLVVSPYSLSSLLGILTIGALGDTRDQFMDLLHIHQVNTMMTDLDQLGKSLVSTHQQQNFAIANALWVTNNYSYKKSFLDLTNKDQFINLFKVDFARAPENARQEINHWVEKKTGHYIKQLLQEGSVTSETRLVLTNAIYFKGLWQKPFKRANTQQKTFTLMNGSHIKVQMMQQEGKFLYTENDRLQMLMLSYSNSSLAMAILLPKPKHPLMEIITGLDSNAFTQLVKSSREAQIEIIMPKFLIASTFSQLNESLQSMGLMDAFTDKANFLNISNNKLMISSIIQKAMIKVDEEGTVAAAATGGLMVATAYVPPILFHADHPFIYIIFDTKSGILLFMGQVMNPS